MELDHKHGLGVIFCIQMIINMG